MSSVPEDGIILPTRNAFKGGIFADRNLLWLGVIVAAGSVLRLIALGYKSFWIDEIASVAIARRAPAVFWRFLWHDEANMAAYYVLLRPWLHFGYGEGTLRLLSVIPGIAAIPLMYVLARRLFNPSIALFAALFLSFNACAIQVSQEARAYSFVVFAVLLSTYLFVLLVEAPKFSLALAYAITAGLGCYFHYFCVLVPAAHYVSVAAIDNARRSWKLLLFAASVIAIVGAPIVWMMHAQDTGHISWVQPTSWLEFYHLGAYLSAATGKVVGGVLLALNLVLIGLFFRACAVSWPDVDTRWHYVIVASVTITPILITAVVSLIRPAFYHRFLIVCLPGWIVMTAVGAGSLSRAWRAIAVVCICGLSIASTVILYHRVTEDWRNAVQFLIAEAGPADRVLYYQAVGEFAGENYRDWLSGGAVRRPLPATVDAGDIWKQEVNDAPRVWMVLYRAKLKDPEVSTIQQLLEQRRLRLKSVHLYPGVTLLEFDRQ